MNPFEVKKILDRLNTMMDNAMADKDIETCFDETIASALESKLNRHLLITKAKTAQIEEERLKIKELISDISHQTKTPIANLMLYSELLLEQEGVPEESRELVKEISSQSQKLNFLISALIKTSRLEAGIIALEPSVHSLEKLMNDVASQMKHKAVSKNIEVVVEPINLKTVFDYKWTSEALVNILDNAVKYTAWGGTIKFSVTAYELFCRMDIKDNGMGIPEQEQNKVFSRFYRSPSVSDIEGVGLGLYLAREIIESQRGYIKLQSEPQKGSTFSVFLPI